MDRKTCELCDQIGKVKQRVEILRDILLAVYVAGKEGVYDVSSYLEAIHGSVEQAREAAKELQEIQDSLKKGETS